MIFTEFGSSILWMFEPFFDEYTFNNDLVTIDINYCHQVSLTTSINILKMIKCLTDSKLSDDEKRKLFSQIVDESVIIKWFCDNHHYLNSSLIVHHRKNFFREFRQMLDFVEFNCSLREYLSKISEEYDTYNSISKVLHGLIDYTSDAIKQRVVDEFIKCFKTIDSGNGRKQYTYDPQFTGCNCELNSFDEFMKFHANNVDKYFLIRCVHLFMAYRRSKKGRLAPFLVLGEMSIINNVKRIVKQAEEELSMN